MRLFAISMVRNEADVIEAFVRHTLDLVDGMVVVDHASADVLESFTTLAVPDGFLARIRGAADPRAEGIALAVALAEEMLAIPGVVGVNLSGGRDGGEESFAEAQAEIARRLR